jgi:hypothetical protein
MKIIAYRSTLCFIFCERRYGSDTDTREVKKQKNNKCHIQCSAQTRTRIYNYIISYNYNYINLKPRLQNNCAKNIGAPKMHK